MKGLIVDRVKAWRYEDTVMWLLKSVAECIACAGGTDFQWLKVNNAERRRAFGTMRLGAHWRICAEKKESQGP